MFDYEVNTLQGLTYKMFQWQRFPVVPLFHKLSHKWQDMLSNGIIRASTRHEARIIIGHV